MELVCSRHEHFDADTLIDQLPRKGNAGYVSRPTVYRTLAEFVDAGLLHKFQLDGRAVYDRSGHPYWRCSAESSWAVRILSTLYEFTTIEDEDW